MLPVDVLKQAQEELLNWNNQGVSVMEMSHRDPAYVRTVSYTHLTLPTNREV